jgi:hypothetical protein
MKNIYLALFAGFFSLASCVYDVPLSTDHSIPIDASILGSWKLIPETNQVDEAVDGKPTDSKDGVRIYPFSDTEYSVHYYEDNNDFYFRAYRINVGGVSAVQLVLIGTNEEAVTDDEDDRYVVASYKIVEGLLEIRTLNTELVKDDLPDSESLKKAFIEHKDNPELFNDPGLFRRVQN